MRKLTLALILMALILAFAVVPAFADVHGVSQAGCGGAGQSGATQSRGKGGRPGPPIPTTASGNTSGRGGAADANC